MTLILRAATPRSTSRGPGLLRRAPIGVGVTTNPGPRSARMSFDSDLGRAPNVLLADSSPGRAWRWRAVTTPKTLPLFHSAVMLHGGTAALAVGAGGWARWQGDAWQPLPHPSAFDLRCVRTLVELPQGEVLVAGDGFAAQVSPQGTMTQWRASRPGLVFVSAHADREGGGVLLAGARQNGGGVVVELSARGEAFEADLPGQRLILSVTRVSPALTMATTRRRGRSGTRGLLAIVPVCNVPCGDLEQDPGQVGRGAHPGGPCATSWRPSSHSRPRGSGTIQHGNGVGRRRERAHRRARTRRVDAALLRLTGNVLALTASADRVTPCDDGAHEGNLADLRHIDAPSRCHNVTGGVAWGPCCPPSATSFTIAGGGSG